MWIVTREENQYDQYGEYFVCAFYEKPTFKRLKKVIGGDDVTIGKLTKGGGRQGVEGTWFNLNEFKDGERLTEEQGDE